MVELSQYPSVEVCGITAEDLVLTCHVSALQVHRGGVPEGQAAHGDGTAERRPIPQEIPPIDILVRPTVWIPFRIGPVCLPRLCDLTKSFTLRGNPRRRDHLPSDAVPVPTGSVGIPTAPARPGGHSWKRCWAGRMAATAGRPRPIEASGEEGRWLRRPARGPARYKRSRLIGQAKGGSERSSGVVLLPRCTIRSLPAIRLEVRHEDMQNAPPTSTQIGAVTIAAERWRAAEPRRTMTRLVRSPILPVQTGFTGV